MTYRRPWAHVSATVLVALAVVLIGLTVWQPAALPFALFAPGLLWLAALAWVVPAVRIGEEAVAVENAFLKTTVPYAAMTAVSGGSRLSIESRGGATVIAAAVPGRGVFTVNAVRKRDAYGSFFTPVTTVDDLRVDAREPDTAATRVANIIRRRIANVDAKTFDSVESHRTPRVAMIAITVVMTAVAVLAIVVR